MIHCLNKMLVWKFSTDCHFNLLYRYFIALREIYQNVCPEVPGNPRDVIFPDAEGGGKYNISGIPGNRGTNVLVYFPKSNEITVMLHFTRENARKLIRNSSENVTPADSRDVKNNVARTVKCPSLFQSDVLSIPKISAVNITFAVPAISGQYNVTQYLAR